VYLGLTFSGSWNLNLDCPDHGPGTPYWADYVARTERRRADLGLREPDVTARDDGGATR
jgi:hypothetical protein